MEVWSSQCYACAAMRESTDGKMGTDERYRALLDVSSAIAEQPTVKAVLHSLRGVLSATCRLHGKLASRACSTCAAAPVSLILVPVLMDSGCSRRFDVRTGRTRGDYRRAEATSGRISGDNGAAGRPWAQADNPAEQDAQAKYHSR